MVSPVATSRPTALLQTPPGSFLPLLPTDRCMQMAHGFAAYTCSPAAPVALAHDPHSPTLRSGLATRSTTDASDAKLSNSNTSTCRNMLLTTDLPSDGNANAGATAAAAASPTWHGSAHAGKASGSVQGSKLLLHPWTEHGDGAAATPGQDGPDQPAGNNASPSVPSKGALFAMPPTCGSDLCAAVSASAASMVTVRSTSSSSDAALHVMDVARKEDTAVSSGEELQSAGAALGADIALMPSAPGSGIGRRFDALGVPLPPCPPGTMLECLTRNSFLSAIAELDGREGDDAHSEAAQTEGSLLGTLSLRPSTTSNTNSTPCSHTPVHQQQHQQHSSHASTPTVLGRSSSGGGGGSRMGGLLRSSSSGAGRVGGPVTGGSGSGAGFPSGLFRCSSSGANRGGYEPSRAYLHQSWQHLDSPTVPQHHQLQPPFSTELQVQAQPPPPPGSAEQDPAIPHADASFGPCLQVLRPEATFEGKGLVGAVATAPEAAPCTFDFWAHGAAQSVPPGPADDAGELPAAQSPSRCTPFKTVSSPIAASTNANFALKADATAPVSPPSAAPPGAAEPPAAPLPPRTGSSSDQSVSSSSSSGTATPTRRSREASQHYFNASQQQQQQLALGHSLWSASASGSDSRASDTALPSPRSLQLRSSTTCTSFVSTDAGMSVTAAMTSFCSGASVTGGAAAPGAKANMPLRCVSALDGCKEAALADGAVEEGDLDEGTPAGGFTMAGLKGRRAGIGMILGTGGAAWEGKVKGREAQRQLPAMAGEGGAPWRAAAGGKADAAQSQGGGEHRYAIISQ